ncbi:GlxA family transcriptional regulator [Actinocorallia populi]|uniref:GlxA family transcriptional regulator n=1 Tax=Actinocorallia populi TaxID=2079200 RepID=UPI000D08F3F7|nr:GlxA family transcriptional regulator [Actinocorallia populi]
MRVVFLIYPGFQSLDLTGPLEVFSLAGGYEVETVGMGGGVVRAHSGLGFAPDRAAQECAGPIDTLVVVGGEGTRQAVADTALLDWVREAAGRSRRVSSVCSGAFVLAAAGLLEGRAATTHWRACGMLGEFFPGVDVHEDRIFVVDGPLWTSAGVTSGIDMALAMVESDLGPEAALRVARELVVFVQRPGGQAQFSAQLSASRPRHPALAGLQSWIPEHLDADLSVPALAERAAMSPRHFARMFVREVGVTPGSYVESVRVETARRLLESTALPVDVIARTCGFGTPETMHRSFRRRISVTPGAYRRRFGTH